MPARRPTLRRSAGIVGLVVLLAGVTGIGWLWLGSRVPDRYSVMTMGIPDLGGGPSPGDGSGAGPVGHAGHAGHAGGPEMSAGQAARSAEMSMADLTGPRTGRADVAVTLVARQEDVTLADGRRVSGYTLNGSSPGPVIEARQGDLVQVALENASVNDGVTLHWHGVDVPNAEDGVAGVTQDAVRVGGTHVYRFVADRSGTYWYHSHNVAHRQVVGGLFGVVVIRPRTDSTHAMDVVAAVHTYDNVLTVNGRSGTARVAAAPSQTVRLRAVNTDSAPVDATIADRRYLVAAVDGYDVHAPDPVTNRPLRIPAGGRADLLLTMPSDGSPVRVQIGADGLTALVLGDPAAEEPPPAPFGEPLDLLDYGGPAPLAFDPAQADRRFAYDIGRRPGFVDGRPGLWWTINGRLFPDVPMFMVAEGDVVVMTLTNGSGELHPMHLHGHHAVVLSRNGVPASGSPWWVDSLDVADGETFEIAFVADNPGVWMDHCHNLPHAAEGLVAHLMYFGVTTPFEVGGAADNHPE